MPGVLWERSVQFAAALRFNKAMQVEEHRLKNDQFKAVRRTKLRNRLTSLCGSKIMLRHYYISDDLDDLKMLEDELSDSGFVTPQFHVLTEQDAECEKRHLHAIEPVLKKDVVHLTQVGAIVGLIVASALMFTSWLLGLHESPVGWMPIVFVAIVALGFCTWEGGLIGIQLPHYQFKRFQKTLADGYHVFFVDVDQNQELLLDKLVSGHPRLKLAGTDEATPAWVVRGQDRLMKVARSI